MSELCVECVEDFEGTIFYTDNGRGPLCRTCFKPTFEEFMRYNTVFQMRDWAQFVAEELVRLRDRVKELEDERT